MSTRITYEQPLNERVRTFLRLEFLFDLAQHHVSGSGYWDSRLTLGSILDVVDLLGRSDVKTELIKELEKHANTLSALKANPGVDRGRLDSILTEINSYLTELRDTSCQPGQSLRRDELVSAIRQRNAIPGGTCSFDLPGYHYWLNRPLEERRSSLETWQADLMIVKRAMKLALHMLRNSTTPNTEVAEKGFFQRPIEPNVACQLIRVIVPSDCPYFPEISGGKHRFTIRFMEQPNTYERPAQTTDDVEFELHCCIL